MNPFVPPIAPGLYAPAITHTRAQRRAASQARARAERSQRRSRARIERALSTFPKEGTP